MKKVLVVDDTKNIRMSLSKCLELEGYEVMTASDGKQALDLFIQHTFDLAFLDIKLPEIRGTEVLKRIREHGIKTPVIIITAYATVKNAVDCTNMGAVAYIQKPFSVEKIKSVLAELNLTTTCIERQDTNTGKLLMDIIALLEMENYDKALEFSKRALSIDINNPEIYLLISKAFRGLGNEENAERFYQFYNSYSL
jgi:two-component system, OmpR family, response regulator